MSEFRQDLVTGDWVILAPERARRPHDLIARKTAREAAPKETCPFEDLRATGNWPPILSYPDPENWRVVVIPNKFPALAHKSVCAVSYRRGPYELKSGIGEHDVVITRDHHKTFPLLAPRDAREVLRLIQKRYQTLVRDRCLFYALGFHNWGTGVGASIYHPHYQILTLPVVPNHIRESLAGSEAYFKKNKRCAHCTLLAHERREKKRVLAQNQNAIAILPYASRREFELRVFPRRHLPFFERTPESVLKDVSALLQETLRLLRKRLKDPDLNFYIHSAPIGNQDRYGHYHWHIEIIPSLPPPPAGFELGSGMEINTLDPDKATAFLLGHKI